jgi:hypothetical protein
MHIIGSLPVTTGCTFCGGIDGVGLTGKKKQKLKAANHLQELRRLLS